MIKEIINIEQKIVEVAPYDEEDSFLSTEQFEEILDFISTSGLSLVTVKHTLNNTIT